MKKLTLLLLFITSLITPNFATPHDWESGFYQGIIGYVIEDDNDTQLAIGCNWGNGDHIEHSILIISNGIEVPMANEDGEIAPIEFAIDGQFYIFPRESHSEAGAIEWKKLSKTLSEAKSFDLFWDGEYLATFKPKDLDLISGIASCAPMRERDDALDTEYYAGNSIGLNNQIDNTTTDHLTSNSEIVANIDHSANQPATSQEGKIALVYKKPYYAYDLIIPKNGFGIDYQVQNITDQTEVTYLTLISGYQKAITIDTISLNGGECPLSRAEKGGLANPENVPEKIRALYGDAPIFPIMLQPGESTYFIFKPCSTPQNLTITTDQGIQEIQLLD